MKTLIKIIVVAAIVAGIALWAVHRPSQVSGEEFRTLVRAADRTSASAWYLYESAGDNLCFKHPTRFIDKKYCVSKNELDLIGKRTAPYEPRAMGEGEFVLKSKDGAGQGVVF
ncbi:hypothetical protein PRJ39_24810 [Lysobacter enzymogenes]|uniref:hypothetical protein n=1 Tax=Lysobacter enzymogenes TaxID=69 RepID=UPI00374825AD